MQKDKTTDFDRMRQLAEEMHAADIAYYKYDDPQITDREYDRKYDELKFLENKTGIILSASPTRKVSGEIRSELKSVRHTKPMLSADKTHSVDEFISFAEGRDVLISWKLDGLTLVLRYENGNFIQAITRGREGILGEDVTHTVRQFLNVPVSIPMQDPIEVRGEGVISWKNFNEINSRMDEPYRHPRGVAAGSVRKLDASEARERKLEFIAFDLISDKYGITDKEKQLLFMMEQGFDVVPYVRISANCNRNKISNELERFNPKSYAYPVDGLIMEYADTAYGKSLGATGHHENRMLALKWDDESYETRFLDIEPAVTKNGMISLTGLFEPVEIDGTMVSRAYLHNIGIVEDLKLGKGDVISVYKANMIIPQIAENKTKSNTLKLPDKCPCCGEKLTLEKTEGGTKQLYCRNPNCVAKLVRRFVHFCEKTRMDIEGLSEKTLSVFIGKGWIHNFGDLYTLAEHREEIIHTDGFGVRSYERLIASIEKSRRCTLNRFIAAMGIHTVGRTAGRIINEYFQGDWNAFEKALNEHFDFTILPDFGTIMNDNLYRWYADKEEANLWHPLLNKITFIKEENKMATKENVFAGKTIVATGKLTGYTRAGINDRITSLGAKAGSSVSRNTDYLIVGEKAGSKLAKAQQLGITILSEDEFERMIA